MSNAQRTVGPTPKIQENPLQSIRPPAHSVQPTHAATPSWPNQDPEAPYSVQSWTYSLVIQRERHRCTRSSPAVHLINLGPTLGIQKHPLQSIREAAPAGEIAKTRKCPSQSFKPPALSAQRPRSTRRLRGRSIHCSPFRSAPSARSILEIRKYPHQTFHTCHSNQRQEAKSIQPSPTPSRSGGVFCLQHEDRPAHSLTHPSTQSSPTPSRSGGVLRGNGQIGPPSAHPDPPNQVQHPPDREAFLRGNGQIGSPTTQPHPPNQVQHPPDREAYFVVTGRSARPQPIRIHPIKCQHPPDREVYFTETGRSAHKVRPRAAMPDHEQKI